VPAIVLVASGFGAGVFAGLSVAPSAWPVWVCVALFAAAGWVRARAASVVGLACLAGGLWGSAVAARAGAECAARWRDGERVALLVEPWDLGEPGGRSRVRVRAPEPCRGILAAVWPRGVAPPRGAAAVTGTWYGGARRGPAWWPARPAAGGRLVVRGIRPVRIAPSPRVRLRLAAERRLVAMFGWPRFALVSALTLGSSDQLDPGMRRRFAGAGLAHILAISGLHVGILAAALVLALQLARVPPGRARLCAVPAVAAYVWLLGMPPPALRAVCLLTVWELARARQRPPVRSAVLSVTALVVALFDPFAVGEVGPCLSFAGAWGAAEGAKWLGALEWNQRWRESRPFKLAQVAAVSLGATLSTAPISAVAFGTVATAAVATNLVAIPVVGVLVPALALALAASPFAAPVAAVAAAGAGLLLDLLERIAATGSELPFALVSVADRVRVAVMLTALVWLWRRIALPKRRAPFRGIVAWRSATLGAALGTAVIWAPVVPRAGSGYRPGWLEIHFLQVGEGDAAVIRTPAGRWVLIDGGPRTPGRDAGASVVVPFLRRVGVRRLAVVIASHGDADHLGGLPAVLRAFPAELVLEPGEPLGSGLYRQWLAAVAGAGARWHRARAGETVALDGVVLRILHPDSAWFARGLPANESGVVLQVEFGRFRALFPGDAGIPMEAERLGAVGGVTLLKVSHHGSLSANGPTWIARLAPRVCVVSVGFNRYGHPASGVLHELARAGCTTYRTDEDGAVRIATDGRVALVTAGARQDSIPLTARGSP
jgi:competence protein ComEC